MPVYEFFCPDCKIVFNFYSPTVNTSKIPLCPKCKKKELKKMMSGFATLSSRQKENDLQDSPLDEDRVEKALQVMEKEMPNLNGDDPRQAAILLRKMAEVTGGGLDEGMEEALHRMESGEDPEEIEAEMGDQLNPENIFLKREKTGKRVKKITYNETLYEL